MLKMVSFYGSMCVSCGEIWLDTASPLVVKSGSGQQSTAGQLRTSGSLSKRISDDGKRRLAL